MSLRLCCWPQKLSIKWNYRASGTTGFLWKTFVCGGLEGSISSAWPGRNQREIVCATGAGWWGKCKICGSVFPHFSLGEGGEQRHSALFCLMWYLLDVLPTGYLGFTFLLWVCSLQHIFSPKTFFKKIFWKNYCILSLYLCDIPYDMLYLNLKMTVKLRNHLKWTWNVDNITLEIREFHFYSVGITTLHSMGNNFFFNKPYSFNIFASL